MKILATGLESWPRLAECEPMDMDDQGQEVETNEGGTSK